MLWQEVKVRVPKCVEDIVIDILNNFGAGGVIISDSNFHFKSEEIKWENIIAYFKNDENFPGNIKKIKKKIKSRVSKYLKSDIAKRINIELSQIKNKDWSTSWQKYFSPTSVGNNFMICPGWSERPVTEKKIIEIDPGQAFGVGTHESTVLAVKLMEKYFPEYSCVKHVLDVGIGTGILSIIAAKMGFKYIFGVDISNDAIRTARKNININRVSDCVALQKRDISEGVNGSYSLIIANLLPEIIDKVLGEIIKYMERNGIIILSGIIKKDFKKINLLAQKQSLILIDYIQDGEWISCVLQKG